MHVFVCACACVCVFVCVCVCVCDLGGEKGEGGVLWKGVPLAHPPSSRSPQTWASNVHVRGQNTADARVCESVCVFVCVCDLRGEKGRGGR